MAEQPIIGEFFCFSCGCCKQIRPFTRYSETHIRCVGCSCVKDCPNDTTLSVRVYAAGIPSLELIEKISSVIKAFGMSTEDVILSQEIEGRYYVEIPQDVITTKLRIEEFRSTGNF